MKSLKRTIQRQVMKIAPKSWRHKKARELLSLPTEFPEELTIRVAQNRQEVESALHLVYQCYLAMGYTQKQSHELRITPYHLLQSTSVIIACLGDKVIGTMSLIRDNPMGLPLEKEYDLTHLRKNGERLCEGGTFAIDPNFRGSHGALMHRIVRYTMIYLREHFGVDQVVLVANPKMADLWESIYLFEPLSKNNIKKDYDFANGHAAFGLSLDLRTHLQRYRQTYQYKPTDKNWFEFLSIARLPGEMFPEKSGIFINHSIMDTTTIKYFGGQRTNALADLTESQRRALANSYGYDSIDSFLEGGRPSERVRIDVKMLASIATDGGGEFVEVRNISRHGLLVKMRKIDLNTEGYQLSLNLGQGEIANVLASVRWMSTAGLCGMQITKSSMNWEILWSQLLKQRPSEAA